MSDMEKALKVIHAEQERLVEMNIAAEVMKDRLVLELAKKCVELDSRVSDLQSRLRWGA